MSTSAGILHAFTFANLPVRGRLLRLTGLDTHVPTLTDAPEHLRQTLGELLAVAALLAHEGQKGDTKTGGTDGLGVTLQVQHPEKELLMFAHCGPDGTLKAYGNPGAAATPFAAAARQAAEGRGAVFAVTLEPPALPGAEPQRVQSLIPLSRPDVSGCIEAYFDEAVQTPTYLRVWTGPCPDGAIGCGALLLQALPDAATQGTEEFKSADDWQRLGLLLQTLTPEEILPGGPDVPVLLQRLFAEDDLELFDEQKLDFKADNPRPRMLAALAALAPETLAELLEEGPVTLTDATTGRTESFDAEELKDFLTINRA